MTTTYGSDSQVEDQGVFLVLDPEDDNAKFACKSVLPRWAMMKMAVAAKSADEMDQVAALIALTEAFLKPEERTRFNTYMGDHDEALDNLDTAMSKLVEELSNRPLERVSPSLESSTPTQPSSRVVSFSQGTVREESATEVETPSSTL